MPSSEPPERRAGASCVPFLPTPNDPASLERAFAGAYGAFLVTNFWEHFSAERELQQAAAMARATKAAGVAHAVWSTLEDTRLVFPLEDPRLKTSQGSTRSPTSTPKARPTRSSPPRRRPPAT